MPEKKSKNDKNGGHNILYESDISDARWIAYDLPGNVGWILYFVGLILALMKDRASLDGQAAGRLLIAAAVPALLMAVGIAELISERFHKLDRILPRVRLFRGFGALTLGGVTGALVSLAMLLLGAHGLRHVWFMLAGGILCGVFAGLLLRRYRRISGGAGCG